MEAATFCSAEIVRTNHVTSILSLVQVCVQADGTLLQIIPDLDTVTVTPGHWLVLVL